MVLTLNIVTFSMMISTWFNSSKVAGISSAMIFLGLVSFISLMDKNSLSSNGAIM